MTLDNDRTRALRTRSQRLDGRLGDPLELVRELVGVQAQEPGAAALSIAARTEGVDSAAVERALVEERTLVRTWTMRGTIHVVPAEDAGWLVDLFAPLALPGADRRLSQLGVPAADRPKALAAIETALGERGPLTRAELMEHVARVGVNTGGQAAAHLARLAALNGIVVFGPPRSAKPTYVLRDAWLAGAAALREISREEALAELARRYLGAYGPAAPDDLAAWSGLPLRDARAGWEAIAPELTALQTAAGPAWLRSDPAPWLGDPPPDPPRLRLLPAFDTYLLGYRTRALAVPAGHERRVWPGGGIVRPTIVANGLARGTWRHQRRDERVTITIEPFPDSVIGEQALAEEVAHIEAFLGVRAKPAG